MAETLSLIDNNIIVTQKPFNREYPGAESTESLAPADKSPFRRIEFHPARKPFTGFTKGGGDGSFRLETLNPTTSSKNTNGNQQSVGSESGSSGKKRDASEMENGLDPELSFAITIRRIGAGLENLGNTCFLNSVLQCLTYTEPLAAYLQSGKHQVSCRKAGFCALCAIQKHVSRALELSGRSLAPKDLVSNLRCISRTFRNSRQEDAHEYMVNLLESMHKCCLPNGLPSESQTAYDKSLVHKIFGGRLRSQVKCMQCNYCSNKFDPFLDLSLEILKADTLYKAFANFTAKEQLDGGAKQYQCQQCKQKVKALKQLTIHKPPNVLTVHLKRFGSHMSGQKIDKKIQFGSTLDLKPFVTGPYDGDLKYTLYGVLVHAGWSTHSGHYYCFVRTSSGMWYSLDDNRVYQVSEKKVFEQKAYMLFYFKDRKNFPPKKNTTDVVHHKEKIVMNPTVNRPGAPKEAQMKTGGSNGSLNGHKSMASVGIERNGFSPVAPKETQTNTSLSNGSLNGHMSSHAIGNERNGSGLVAPNGTQTQTQTNTSLSNGSLDGHKSLVTVDNERNGSGLVAPKETQTTPNISNGLLNGHKTSITEKNGSSLVAPKETQMNPNSSNMPLNGHKPLTTIGTEKNGFTSNGAAEPVQTKPNLSNRSLDGHKSLVNVGTVRNGLSNGALEQPQKKENSAPKSVTEPTSESKIDAASKIEDYAKETGGNSGVNRQIVTALPESSSLTKVGPTKNASGKKTHKKVNKFLKCKNVISMKFSSKALMGISLTQRKKKKHKRTKRAKNLAQENSVNESPSSSVKTEAGEPVKPPVEIGFKENSVNESQSSSVKNDASEPVKPAVRNRFKDNSVNESQSSDKIKACESVKVKQPVENGFKERVNKDGAVLATSDYNGVSNTSQSKQKDLVLMLTRGLEDRAVPRWDEDDSTVSQRRETTRDLTIGYIGDEWDEEYDRGKRKKVRMSQTEFDGKNPFQNIANERLKSHAEKQNLSKRPPPMMMKNKQKFKKSHSGNGPFRI